ncbi:type II secretion system minor pseudopilin GspK [Vibrio mangrovi]|uniref:Type II secretion system protein K n=1 Tax=Vibrio mangrovi TaxID=474394 RepID=A0A1Y6IYS3_9VIBR|nr:type II secretion system minor pseudopilin GspK [Vibrio mangrovi]MDW6002640.1 type II secretion system minor pseudopilin GspK [Vibrio mangrovi]SMS02799.1 Putative type II secretion system protein K [Vibrio mangrovi]
MYPIRSLRKQRGVALIIVLLLLAMMVSIAATMSERLFTQYHRSGNQLRYQQAYWYSLGVEALAKSAIEQSYEDDDEAVNLSQPWAVKDKEYPLDFGTVEGSIRDMQSCLNVNVLSGIEWNPADTGTPYLIQTLQHLIESVESDSYQAEIAANSIWEFIDTNRSINTTSGVEDNFYESMSPAYDAPDSLLADVDELRAVQGVSGKIMMKSIPYLCALPTKEWRLNVNTLSVEQANILAAMFYPYLSSSAAAQLIENRPYSGWSSLDDFLEQGELSGVDETVKSYATGYLGVDSHYFELDAQVMVDDARVRVRSLMFSKDRKDVTVIRRRYGGERERISARPAE